MAVQRAVEHDVTDRLSIAASSRRLLLLGVLCCAVFLRFMYLDRYPDFLHHDAMAFGADAQDMTQATFWRYNGPMTIWTTLALRWSHNALWGLRVPVAAAGVLLCGAIYLLGRDLFSPPIGLIAAALTTTNMTLLCWSRIPDLLIPTPFVVLSCWCGVRAYHTRRVRRWAWAALGGALAGYAGWGYWGATAAAYVTYVSLAACCVATTGLRRWIGLFIAWCLGFIGTSPQTWQHWFSGGPAVNAFMLGKLATALSYSADSWWFHLSVAWFSLWGGYDRAQIWFDFTHHPLILEVDAVGLGLCAAALLYGEVSRPVLASIVLTAALIWFVCGVLPPDPGTHFHQFLIPVAVCLLSAVGLAQLRWSPLVLAATLTVCCVHLVLLYEAVAPARAEAVTTAAYWLGNHQPIKGCVSLLRRPRDPEYGAMLWALTMRLPGGLQVHDGIPDCPTLIVFPGVPIPPMPPGRWSILENVAGPMYVFQAEEAGG